MILIADCGGTKVEWCLIEKKEIPCRFVTPGMHALMLTQEEMQQRIADEVVPKVKGFIDKIEKIYFYGAGCVSAEVCLKVRNAIHAGIPCADIEVATDLLGAARALCGHKPGIACILGTGSNSCYYDGEKIAENVSPLGYILGDEGSGAVLGKILVGDVLKGQLPKAVCEDFLTRYDLDAVKIVQKVYREPYPNKFLATFTYFLKENLHIPEIKNLVLNAFKQFFKRNVMHYPENCSVNFCGSVALHFEELVREAAFCYGYKVGQFIANPTDALIEYHREG